MSWIKLGNAVRSQLIQLRSGQSSYVVSNKAPDGRGQGKAVPGGKGKRQPFQSGDATNEGEIVQALYLQAAPGAHEPLLADRREQLAGGRPGFGLTRPSPRAGGAGRGGSTPPTPAPPKNTGLVPAHQ